MRQHTQTYAITAITHQRRRIFQRTATADLFIATLFRYRDAGRFLLHAFVVMPDHIHVVLTPARDHTIERCAQLIKGGFSFAARKEQPGEIWQDSYHNHRVTDQDDLANQILYIVNNPIRKRYQDYPHIHTSHAHAARLDPPPPFL
ncbi:MAG: transposase [Acidobacteriaceae bacterium]